MSEKVERLTDEQVAEALAHAEEWRSVWRDQTNKHTLVADALLQVSADLSAAKEENTRLLQRLPEVALYKLQKAARAAAVVIGRAHGLLDCRTYPKSCGGKCPECLVASDLDVASSALRSLLPEEHEHRFITDDDGAVHPCACGAAWAEEVK